MVNILKNKMAYEDNCFYPLVCYFYCNSSISSLNSYPLGHNVPKEA